MSGQAEEPVFEPVTCGPNDPPFCSHLYTLKGKLYKCIMYDTDATTTIGQDMSLLDDYRIVLKELYTHLMSIYKGSSPDSDQFLTSMDELLTRIFHKNNNQARHEEVHPLFQTTLDVVQQDARQNQAKNSEFIKEALLTMPFQFTPISEGD